ncbi:nicotinamide mononucleotide transporter [Acetobacter sp. DmW_136]|uniref:nicotinamide riboside transporter PnuC n=1 Tax=Acetobacter sp. DmW_136 TaxID=2591091 RepID=UPI00123AF342|nr:nicotinamide riboside transporter PnuC [Acetobacter sp. DmW_136]KAA8384410.1 nicotinamide mononucleotide transporter [Acetobacter sp. DmW_136]
MTGLEWLAAVASALGVWLTGHRTVWCWPVMLLASVLYGVVFAQDHLYADAALQGVFGVLALYGLWCWQRGVQASGQVHIARLTRHTLWRDTGITAVAGLALGLALRGITDDPMPLSDAGLSAYSVLGQIWTAKRYRACWVLWIVVDVLYALLFVQRRLFVTAVLYTAFVGLAAQGWWRWRHVAARSP